MTTPNTVRDLLTGMPSADETARTAVALRADSVLRPAGALAALDNVAVWLAGWQRTAKPNVERPAVVVFVGEHGVCEEGVSAYPSEVTAAMDAALRAGVATAAVMAKALGATLEVVDVGVGKPTANFVSQPAMSVARFSDSFDAGSSCVRRLAAAGADILVIGEMGIGNTTAAAAVAATLCGGQVTDWVGIGTGIDDAGVARKRDVVERARERAMLDNAGANPFEVLRQVGGTELVAMCGAVIQARLLSLPVVLDGYVVTAAIAPVEFAIPGALDHVIAGHRSFEPGHGRLLERLGKTPLIDLGLRLGEASGALVALPIISLAAKCVVDVATFAEFGLV